MASSVRVWDLPTRIFHWLLALSVIGLVATAYIGDNSIVWHARLGMLTLGLLVFRIVWGFVGGRWSRFASFIYAPRSVVGYLRGQAHPDHLVGHSPLGAASVFAMLLVLLAQLVSGLLSDDEIAFTGPLNRFVDTATGLSATWYHKAVGQWLVIGLVVLHVAAILYYLVKKRQNLVHPMLTGDKEMAAPAGASRDDALTRIGALVLAAASFALAGWVWQLGA